MTPTKANALRERGVKVKCNNKHCNYTSRPDFAYYESLKRLIPQGLSQAEYDNAVYQAARKAGI